MGVSIGATLRDEGPYLIEWLAWHKLLGAEQVLIASNDCADGSDRMLEALASAGEIQHLPQPPADAPDPVGAEQALAQKGLRAGRSVQWRAYDQIYRQFHCKNAQWFLFCDLDEFPMIHVGAHRWADLLAALPGGLAPEPGVQGTGTDALALPWRLFGNAGVVGLGHGPLCTRFTRSAPPELLHPVCASFFKTLFRPAAFQGVGIHRPAGPVPGRAALWRDGSGRALPEALARDDRRLALLGLNGGFRHLAELHHHSLRSAEGFVVKTARGLPNRRGKAIDLSYWVERNFNTVENTAARVLEGPLAAEMARLRALPGIATLEAQALDWHRDTCARLLALPGPYALFRDILHAQGSAVLPAALAHRLLKLHQGLAR